MLRALDKLVNSEVGTEVAVAVGLAFDAAARARFARAVELS